MALKIPYASSLKNLSKQIAELLEGATLHLYKNNHTPANADALDASDYVEADFPGYSSQSLDSWPFPSLDGSNRASSALSPIVFTAGAIVTPQDVYGIYVLDVDGDLAYAELDPGGPRTFNTAGQTESYTPVFTFKSTN